MAYGDPVFNIVRHQQGRSLAWLARQTGYSHAHVRHMAAGMSPCSARFRAACMRVLGLPEADLFHDDGVSHGGAPVGPDAGLDEPADTGLRARLYPDGEEGRIVRIA
jgi:hypothetical protein